ncbi:hypothetical protein BWQ96_02890 [Gracilariopsis chorda]|uniref:Uncharacterized protein n=1 Tax=Gracilariopsis chorda TaxID=448386 RepID=A0A2V3J022_9FLOR|nr:hypothetical protein BWQ96_02890 [Gracilariopsis chorda]|eukprot:PXF47277.1 hypothetical protein BWQ96_02890 [Gracilariopsis chorda]
MDGVMNKYLRNNGQRRSRPSFTLMNSDLFAGVSMFMMSQERSTAPEGTVIHLIRRLLSP